MVKTSCNYCKKSIKNMQTFMALDKSYCSIKCRNLGIFLNNNIKDNKYKENEDTYIEIKMKENIEKKENNKVNNKNIKILLDNGLLNDNYQNYCNIF